MDKASSLTGERAAVGILHLLVLSPTSQGGDEGEGVEIGGWLGDSNNPGSNSYTICGEENMSGEIFSTILVFYSSVVKIMPIKY